MTSLRFSPEHPLGIKKVQVGCGPKNILPSWWNVDIRNFTGIDQVMDVTKPWQWDAVLDFVYGEHFLEHLKLEDSIKFLKNAAKALKPQGKIRLSTPSLEWILATHFDLNQDNSEKRISQTFAINRAFHGWGHQFLYSRSFLQSIVEAVGFKDAKFCNYGESSEDALCGMERHGGYNFTAGYPSVWILEATLAQPAILDLKFLEECNANYTQYVNAGH